MPNWFAFYKYIPGNHLFEMREFDNKFIPDECQIHLYIPGEPVNTYLDITGQYYKRNKRKYSYYKIKAVMFNAISLSKWLLLAYKYYDSYRGKKIDKIICEHSVKFAEACAFIKSNHPKGYKGFVNWLEEIGYD